jgi:hypothetical protein
LLCVCIGYCLPLCRCCAVLCQLYTVTAVKGATLVIQGLNGAPWAPELSWLSDGNDGNPALASAVWYVLVVAS